MNNVELHALYNSPNVIEIIKSKKLRWADHVARIEDERVAFNALTRVPTGQRLRARPRYRWEDNVKEDIRELGYNENWRDLAQVISQWKLNVLEALGSRALQEANI